MAVNGKACVHCSGPLTHDPANLPAVLAYCAECKTVQYIGNVTT